MDIISHGLWAGAAYKFASAKIKKPLNIRLAVFLGIFPDLFSFAVPFAWLAYGLAFGGLGLADLPRPDATEPMPSDTLPIFRLTSLLYNLSHSAIVFAVVFGIVYFILRRPVWEMNAWLLHVLIDIPTHSYKFYPTPFLWPISEWKFDGLSWATPWFLILNYSAIIVVYLFLRKRKTLIQ